MPVAREILTDDPHKTCRSDAIWRGPATLIVILLTIAGAALRLSYLGTKSLWLDEGATVALARASWQHFAWVWWHGEANLQTIYFLLMRGWIHLGSSEAWLRLPSALFGVASIPAMYMVARKFCGAGASLAAVALLTFSPTHVDYSQEARSYTLAILLVLLSSYFFVQAMEENRRRDWALWTAFSILAFYSHDFAALVLLAQAASLVFKPARARWQAMLVGAVIILAAAIPGITYVFRASSENLHFVWMPRPSGKEFWHLAMFFGGAGVKVALALVLWTGGVVAVFRRRREPELFWRGMLVLLWAVVPVAVLAIVSLVTPMFLPRYVIFSLSAMLLLAGMGVEMLAKWKVGPILVVALCAMSLPTIVREYHKPREDWRAAITSVAKSAGPGDAIAFFPFYTRIMFDYYGAAGPPLRVFAPNYYSATGEDVRGLLQVLHQDPHQFRRVWVVVAGDGARLTDFDSGEALEARLQSIYGAATPRKFAEVQVLEYGQ